MRFISFIEFTCTPIIQDVIETCDLGLMKLGRLAEREAESKIREIRLVFVNRAP